MSSDPFSDLARTLGDFAASLRDLVGTGQRPAPGSPADKEADGEPWSGEWSAHPGQDICATVLMTAWSCSDHLGAAAHVLRDQHGMPSLYTLTRGAAEAASAACYLTVTGISPLERIRRNMNRDLEGLWEDNRMLSEFSTPDSARQLARHAERKEAIVREGARNGLAYTKPSPHRAGYLGDKPDSAMQMVDKSASATSGLGLTYQRLWSGVAHGQTHGLARFLMRVPVPAEPGKVTVQMNTSASTLAMHLLAGPLCGSTLIEHLRWWLGWDTSAADPAVTRMLAVWCRIAGVQYAGPAFAR
jgi:hypothetical protein